MAAVNPLHPKVYFARNGRSAGKLPGGSLLTVACQSAAIAVTSKARNTLGRRAAREMLPAAHLGFTVRKKHTRVCARVCFKIIETGLRFSRFRRRGGRRGR